jgi:dephospho-CoA kinase
MDKKIIGLAGTNGSGKDTVGAILAKYHGYLFISVTDLLRDELRSRGLPVERQYLRALSAEWRRQSGLGVLVDKAMEAYEAAGRQYKGVVMASLRNPGEADRIHELGGTLVWIDADPRVRYQRVTANAHSRGRAAEDDKTYQEFLAEEAAEMHRLEGEDDATLHVAAVKDEADLSIENSGDDLAVLEEQIKTTLAL